MDQRASLYYFVVSFLNYLHSIGALTMFPYSPLSSIQNNLLATFPS